MKPAGKDALLHPSATVIPLRDGPEGLEVLMLKRNRKSVSSAGAWVFPGGLIDDVDRTGDADGDMIPSARRAAVREASEEAGLCLKEEDLLLISRWITPPDLFPKRFKTWFFLAHEQGGGDCCIDDCEIKDFMWLTPKKAIDARHRGEMELPPPTFVNLTCLSEYSDCISAMKAMAELGMSEFTPRFRKIPDGFCALYAEDVAYDGKALELSGPRHRLWLRKDQWRYVKKW